MAERRQSLFKRLVSGIHRWSQAILHRNRSIQTYNYPKSSPSKFLSFSNQKPNWLIWRNYQQLRRGRSSLVVKEETNSWTGRIEHFHADTLDKSLWISAGRGIARRQWIDFLADDFPRPVNICDILFYKINRIIPIIDPFERTIIHSIISIICL